MEYTWDFKVILDSFPLLLRGLVVTIELWILAFAIGLSLGFAVSLARVSNRGWFNAPAIGYVEIFRNTPVLVQLIWFYYAFPIILGQQLSPFTAAALALTLNTSAYCAEIFRGGIVSIARGQWEGAKAIGMTRAMTDPEVLLFDEPTSSLDPELVGEVLRVIHALAEEGRTMLLVTHELGFAYHFADRVVFIADGVVYETGTADDVLKHPKRERTQAFLARFTERAF